LVAYSRVLAYRRWESKQIKHIVVGTERSLTPCPAMDLAAEMANRYGAELDIIRVLLPGQPPGTEAGQADAMRASQVAEKLRQLPARLAGPRGTRAGDRGRRSGHGHCPRCRENRR
jgi:hypothetical protein